ncbi:MAG TPA: sulfate adenylyltransferase subunit CysN, partial [Allosphingosinicella sp.]|uniref:sulfate adenylyltransferase subunit CysN n=1 Tax=Allosphingosinicella sp. TaxID=2823234 RepID=UPI002EDB2783
MADLLRFITCGNVDDGKSTLIGRLLHDTKLILDDQLAALASDSRRHGTQGEEIDYALLVDGLEAEREQGITIDVAYRYFATERRKFIVADTPGHEQYTRNMVTGASTADLALILIDARKGVLQQTRRHAYLARLVGISNVVLAVNKMDLVSYDGARFEAIVEEAGDFLKRLGIEEFVAIPLSALRGDNIAARSEAMPWYGGPHLLEHLEGAKPERNPAEAGPFRMPVQWVNRPYQDFRGFCGTIVSGIVRPGDAVRVLPSGRGTRIGRIVTAEGDLEGAGSERAVTLTLTDEVDCSRGDVIAAADAPLEIADQFEATIVWMDEEPMLPGRSYLLKIGAATAGASVTDLKHQVDVNSLDELAAKTLEMNSIGVANIALDRAITFAPYEENRDLGGFILIDRLSNATVGAGMIHFALRRAHNIHWQHLDIDRTARARLKQQKPRIVWFTGLSGAGKSTIANLVEKKLHHMGRHSFMLDGDNVRHGLNKDLGFTDADRVENIRRVAEVSRLMVDAGLIVLVSFISPFRSERRLARELMQP